MKVTTIGPNGHDGATFHVHAEGCRDIKQRKYHRSEKYNEEIDSVREIVEGTYADQIDESDADWQDYINEFEFFPCVGELPLEAEVPSFNELVLPVEDRIEETSENVHEVKGNYPLGKNQKVVLDYMGDHTEYFKGCGWVWYYHSSTIEVLQSLENRGLVERYVHRETGEDVYVITSKGESIYVGLTDAEREIA